MSNIKCVGCGGHIYLVDILCADEVPEYCDSCEYERDAKLDNLTDEE